MSGEFREQLHRVESWAARAQAAGWLNERDLQKLGTLETGSAGELFHDQARRPLVVGFFGGTGTGKSSLLNRLARHAVATAGVRRPTSTRATMYVHRSQELNAFAEGSPISETRIEYHDVDSRRDVAWLDMPDIDSVEADNRQLVLAWLPYVDWLIYVVSPERYRDDAGWQLLDQRRAKHHWLFVVNRWDEAVDLQLVDFTVDLAEAGFDQPRVLRTSCTLDIDDDFEQLESIVNTAIRDHGLQELQRIGLLARLEELEVAGNELQHRFGTDEEWEALCEQFAAAALKRFDIFGARMASELDFVAQRYPPRPAVWRAEPAIPVLPEQELSEVTGSAYTKDLITDITGDMVVQAAARGIRGQPCRNTLQTKLEDAGALTQMAVGDALATALRTPGGPLMRPLRRALEVTAYVLPLLVGAWVTWHVVTRYKQGLSGQDEFLGVDFAIHSILMIGLSWFVPFLLSRWLRPSLREIARRGIRGGLGDAVEALRKVTTGALQEVSSQRRGLLDAYPTLEIRER